MYELQIIVFTANERETNLWLFKHRAGLISNMHALPEHSHSFTDAHAYKILHKAAKMRNLFDKKKYL